MTTYREIVYMVLDELKMDSDDAYYTEAHVMFLVNKYRAFLLKQRYSDLRKRIPLSNFDTLCLTMEVYGGEFCGQGTYLRSLQKIPNLLDLSGIMSATKVVPDLLVGKTISFVDRGRFRYVGHNRWTRDYLYATIAEDRHLYIKSSNPQFRYLDTVKISSVFEDPTEAAKYTCFSEGECGCGENTCDPMNTVLRVQEDLIPQIIELCVRELARGVYNPEDKTNNSSDDLSEINMKVSNGRKEREA